MNHFEDPSWEEGRREESLRRARLAPEQRAREDEAERLRQAREDEALDREKDMPAPWLERDE